MPVTIIAARLAHRPITTAVAALHSTEVAGDREAETGPAVSRSGARFGLRERLEQPSELLLGHANAGLRDGEDEG